MNGLRFGFTASLMTVLLLIIHLARHTFATTVTLGNGVPIESVSRMLGHRNIKTTQIYAHIVDSKVGRDMEELSQKLGNTTENVYVWTKEGRIIVCAKLANRINKNPETHRSGLPLLRVVFRPGILLNHTGHSGCYL